jgi:heat shock protein HslJ
MHARTRFLALSALLAMALVVAGCAAEPTLTGQAWEWGSASTDAPGSETVIPNPERYTIEFMGDGTFAATVDCNQVAGSYTTGTTGR